MKASSPEDGAKAPARGRAEKAQAVFSAAVPELLADHYRQLRASGISDEVIRERGYRSALGKSLLKELGFASSQQRAPALIVPLHGVDGKAAGCQARPDHPRKDNRGRIVKYETPTGSAGRLDVPPRCRDSLADPAVPILITEGAKKADSLASAGACALNISGVWNWKARNRFGGVTVNAELATKCEDYEKLASRFKVVSSEMADELENTINEIEGEIEMSIGDEKKLLKTMETYFITAGIIHKWKTFGSPAKIFDVVAKQS